MRCVVERAQRAAPSEANVLLQGPSGSGKTTLARCIHALSPRRTKPLVEFSCGDLAESVIESELFGHERGAFTGAVSRSRGKFELAHGGTVFLDDVGNLSLRIQAKLLRVVQDKVFERLGGEETFKVDVRVIAATSVGLRKMVDRGAFREDLYWRLNVVTIELPSLAERAQDIPSLVETFVKEFATREHKKAFEVSPALIKSLMDHPWIGNIRELRNAIECMVVLSTGPDLGLADLPSSFAGKPLEPPDGNGHPASRNAGITRGALMQALKHTSWNRSAAAKLLGISRYWCLILIQRYGIMPG